MTADSHTTRPPRDREVDRDDYVFTDREAVEIGREGGEYLSVVDIEGEIYGIMCVCIHIFYIDR